MPWVEAARLRVRRTLPDDPFAPRVETSPGAALNNIGRQRRTSDPRYRVGVGVNSDTLYTSAWLDLAEEPFVLEVPRVEDRYYSFQVGHADSSSDVAFGSRTHGETMPPVFLCSSRYEGEVPAGMLVVRTPTRYVNLPGRILVDPISVNDHKKVHEIQDGIRLRPLSTYLTGQDGPNPAPPQRPLDPPAGSDPRLAFLHELAAVVTEEHLTDAEQAHWAALAPLGFTADELDESALSEAAREEVAAGLLDGQEQVAAKARELGTQVGGWTVNYAGPRFGDDPLLRAGVARDQIFVTVPEEGLYPLGKSDADGEQLHGRHTYRIHFPVLPPVEAFWSVTMYTADGFLVPNEREVYTLGDRTPGVVADDGSATLLLAHAPQEGSWLPAPDGPFYLMLRLFAPRPEVLDRSWLPAPIERLA
ncbi:DUF1254 domain-containing protein [Nocardioides deserti]|uniref:DUF1254 domain-containing protein n=1 Tax=Nocardioides deserti TaxID=1588644 RepID=A0ABR6U7B6_9ACTN|nr:DUF1214 domain-containing protein [Nocardioides deserti]MBC2960033.1 DUF1254 domain-containing protein [Nocardioides deserti]